MKYKLVLTSKFKKGSKIFNLHFDKEPFPKNKSIKEA